MKNKEEKHKKIIRKVGNQLKCCPKQKCLKFAFLLVLQHHACASFSRQAVPFTGEKCLIGRRATT